MNKSEQINELAKALSTAQVEMNGAYKDSKNPFFKSSYADLKQVMSVFQEYYAPKGLAVTQLVGLGEIETVLMHSSGQFVSTSCTLPVAKQNDPQALGSSISYMRRYALSAILGIYQTDDDGEAAMSRPSPAPAISGKPEPVEGEEYRITFGTHKGKTLAQLGVKETTSYVAFMNKQAAESGAKIQGVAAEFMRQAEAFLASQSDWNKFGGQPVKGK